MSAIETTLAAESHFYVCVVLAYIVFSIFIIYITSFLLRKKFHKTICKARREKEKAERSDQLKSAFIANMSHEIRTPLNAIVGFSDIISQTNDPMARVEYMKIIDASNQLLLKLIDDILDMSKIESGILDFSYSEVDVNALLYDMQQQMIVKNNIPNLSVRFAEQMPKMVIRTDRCRITQVINNFLNNALKFTKQGHVTFGYRLSRNNELYFYVRDTGIGIPKDKTEEIFERFSRLNQNIQGTGLGLPICRIIVEQLKGRIGVESEEGRGSEFWFRLPSNSIVDMEESVEEVSDTNLWKQKNPASVGLGRIYG